METHPCSKSGAIDAVEPSGLLGGRSLGWALWTVLLTGCGGSTPASDVPGGAGGESIRRDTTIVHEQCDIDSSSATRADANGDGKPDLISVSAEGRVTCQWMDLNFDRVGDVWAYFAADGSVRRRETDFDRDGQVDEIAVFEAGHLVARQRATSLAGRLDTWQYFKAGVIERGERDANGDEIIDQWWEYPHPEKPDCAVVHSDTNGDGRPDPGATVDLCESEDSPLRDQDEQEEEQLPAADAPITETTAAPPTTPVPAVTPGSAEAPVPSATSPAPEKGQP